jgi:ABC-type transporter Mla subunit MlaD
MLLSEVDNVRQLVELLGDEEFIRALTEAEDLVHDVNATLDRVEQVEDEAAQAVREANKTLVAVDRRLDKVDETINLLEAKIEAGFSLGFLVFAFNFYIDGDLIFAASLFLLGALGAGQLLVTVRNIPQVEKLQEGARYVWEEFRERRRADRRRSER